MRPIDCANRRDRLHTIAAPPGRAAGRLDRCPARARLPWSPSCSCPTPTSTACSARRARTTALSTARCPRRRCARSTTSLKWAPTSANSSPARFVFVTSAAGAERLRPALSPGNLDKTMAAPVTVDRRATTSSSTRSCRSSSRTWTRAAWFAGKADHILTTAFRNGTLQGAYLILAARALGLDCGPMSGFDNAKVDAAFFPDGKVKSNFLCNLGYGDPAKLHAAQSAPAVRGGVPHRVASPLRRRYARELPRIRVRRHLAVAGAALDRQAVRRQEPRWLRGRTDWRCRRTSSHHRCSAPQPRGTSSSASPASS